MLAHAPSLSAKIRHLTLRDAAGTSETAQTVIEVLKNTFIVQQLTIWTRGKYELAWLALWQPKPFSCLTTL